MRRDEQDYYELFVDVLADMVEAYIKREDMKESMPEKESPD